MYLKILLLSLRLLAWITPSRSESRVITATEILEESYKHEVACKIMTDMGDKETCLPQKCSRHVLDGVFEEEDITVLHSIAEKGMSSRGESKGGPTILDINTGFIRDSKGLENLFTRDADAKIFTDEDFGHYGKIISKLKETVMTTMGTENLYFTAPTFITRLDGNSDWAPNEIHDEYWHPHADRNNTPHYHYSGLLYMSTKNDDFTGGDFIFYNPDSFQSHPASQKDIDMAMQGVRFYDTEDTRVEPKAGRVVIFSSGHENPHKVERVLSGQRLVLAFWFTCDESRAFQIFLDGAAHTAFSEDFAENMKNKAGKGAPMKRPETNASKRRRKKRKSQSGTRKEDDAEL